MKNFLYSILMSLSIVALSGCGGGSESSNVSVKVTHLAGPLGGAGALDGTGATSSFRYPYNITSDGTNLYVADMGNFTIRKIVIATGAVTTIAGTAGISGSNDGSGTAARFNQPMGITNDGTNLYVTDGQGYSYTIRKIVIATGAVTTLAGTVSTGSANMFSSPIGITYDGTDLYVADTGNEAIKKIIIATGVVTTFAGSVSGNCGSTDGTGTSALFCGPQGITSDGANLYVTDTNNSTIRKIVIATGVVTTLAGAPANIGSTDGMGASAKFNRPSSITNDGVNLYVTDTNNSTVRKIVIATGVVTTLAGVAGNTGSADGTGAAAGFNGPRGIAYDGTNLYVADTGAYTVRKIDPVTGVVTTIAGIAGGDGSIDGTGATARFSSPIGIAGDGTNLYVADSENHTIRKIVIATGVTTTFAGTSGSIGSTDGTGAAARFAYPSGITSDGTNLYVSDSFNYTIRKIVIATGVVTTLAGSAGYAGLIDGTGTTARFGYPMGITNDGTNLYIADNENNTIRKIAIATGMVTTIAGSPFGNFGSTDGTGFAASFYSPRGITNDGANLYVADTVNSTIRKIVIATGAVTTIAGASGSYGAIDGTGAIARFTEPCGIASDGKNLYVADTGNFTIRKIIIATGVVTTIAGTHGSYGFADGTGAAASFNSPQGVVSNGANLFISDTVNGAIRKISM